MNLMSINGVRGYIDESGTAQLKLEDVSRGLGFTEGKDGKIYVMWRRVDKYLTDLSFGTSAENEFVPENIFYLLAMKASNQAAISFQMKVANEILPSIRKHGAYMTPETIEKTLTDPDFIINLATRLKEETAEKMRLKEKIESDRPLVLYAESMQVSKDSILVADMSKLLKQNGIDIGERRLFQYLREEGYLIKSGSEYNMPTQRSMNLEIMEVKVGQRASASEGVKITRTPKITGKGQIYFINKFLKKQSA
ncbi:antirepressor [Paenibacillus sp. BIHB 4019]|uniref:Antirepressor n=1 Tax=Paenibacillus sp. BIHB 4019 TaxID=1870819 RepID=A0A1B2DHW4_9BACL|nr:phage antirepressor KilAC domain-containing protein [Paenibacillus sp. BIHB 4019]ANY67279.1 antirepressor [Paenibacillus sp. BIHB 4019]